MAAKLIQNIKASKFLKELKEFDNLIKAIGECKSKAEEDRIIVTELEVLKSRFNDSKLDKSRGREYMVRSALVESLSHLSPADVYQASCTSPLHSTCLNACRLDCSEIAVLM